ncbi:hypothetical protein Ddye_026082 [Dipteronia dyeriana]|uniref:Uncharacterized protein n=1 Tax=Dipteronia dyeriana TaxID=168575 RepID=A0AAD9TLJ8_9ROSI|nr:hypothetical protein Ddye_026082 [Dipteronia dyeriana]
MLKTCLCGKRCYVLDTGLHWIRCVGTENEVLIAVFVKAIDGLFDPGEFSGKLLENVIRVIVGRGDRAKLLNDVTVDGTSLKIVFPRIFALACNKTGFIEDYVNWVSLNWKWEVSLRRPLFNWEVEQWDWFRGYLETIKIRDMISNIIGWSHCPKGVFSVNLFRKCLKAWSWCGLLSFECSLGSCRVSESPK